MVTHLFTAFCLFFLCLTTVSSSDDTTIFDGSKRIILYQTSSHAGQKQLQELLRMVPGGESFEVLKMPYGWKNTPEKIHQYPIIISRLAGGFNRQFKIAQMRSPITAEQHDKGLKLLGEIIAGKLERDQPQVFIGINGHYEQLRGEVNGQALLSTAPIFPEYQKNNKDKRVTVLDTVTATHAVYPLGVRSDHMHASPIANYIEGEIIVKELCRRDGIALPESIPERVKQIISEAADLRDAFHVTSPMPIDPKTAFAIGGKMDIGWQVVDPNITGIYVMLHRLGHDDYYLSDRIDVTNAKTGSMQWTVQEPLPVLGNRMSRIKDFYLIQQSLIILPERYLVVKNYFVSVS